MNHSYSKHDTFEKCPRLFKARYLERRPEPKSRPLRIGSGVHAAIAAYDAHLVAERLPTDITWAPEALEAAWAKMTAEGVVLARDERDEISEIFEKFVQRHVLNPECVVQIEKKEAVQGPGFKFNLVMDRLEIVGGRPRITDYKSDHQVRSQADVDRDMQLADYAWAIYKLYGYEEIDARLDFVRHGVVREVTFTLEEILKAEKHLLALVQAIEEEQEWRPTPGSFCSWCPFPSDCPAVSDLPLRCETPEEARRLAEEILVLERQVKERRDILSPWAAINGPVSAGGEIFGHFPPKEGGWTVTDKPVFAEILRGHGLDPWEFLSVDGRKLKSLRTAKKYAPVQEELEPFLAQDLKTTFRHRKEGDQ